MKTNNYLTILLLLILGGCYTPSHVPQKEDLPISTKGSYIKLSGGGKKVAEGELISIDSLGITILNLTTTKCERYPMFELTEFKLFYAQSSNYGSFHLANSILMLVQGYGLIFTAIPYIFVGSAVSFGSYNSYIYTDKIVSIDYIKMFARFPQGLPPGISLDQIK